MRILVISNYYPPVEIGGWEQLVYNVVQKLEERGHKVHILTSNYKANQVRVVEPNVQRGLYLESTDFVHYHPSYTLWRRRNERFNLQLLAKKTAEFEPDIIFINGMWNLPVSLAQKAEELLPKNVVYYMASYWPTETDAHTSYWSDQPNATWKRVFKRALGTLARGSLLESTPRNQLNFGLVLCVSAYVRDYMVNEAGVPPERTRVVYNGIEEELFTASTSRVDPSVLRMLYAGQISPDKGVHTVLKGLALLHQEAPTLPIRLSIYGGGSLQYETFLKNFVAEFGLQEWVSFCGKVPREQMPGVLAEHEVLLFPSIWPEPLARIVQEAMACGLIVIGTGTGGTPEILQDGVNGLMFEADDAAMLAEKITRAAGDIDLREKLAREARRTVEQRFTLDRMVDELEANFRYILNGVE